jgi:hypothetical protein
MWRPYPRFDSSRATLSPIIPALSDCQRVILHPQEHCQHLPQNDNAITCHWCFQLSRLVSQLEVIYSVVPGEPAQRVYKRGCQSDHTWTAGMEDNCRAAALRLAHSGPSGYLWGSIPDNEGDWFSPSQAYRLHRVNQMVYQFLDMAS